MLEAVGLDAMCGVVPGAAPTRLLWAWPERDRQIGRGGRFEDTAPLLLTA